MELYIGGGGVYRTYKALALPLVIVGGGALDPLLLYPSKYEGFGNGCFYRTFTVSFQWRFFMTKYKLRIVDNLLHGSRCVLCHCMKAVILLEKSVLVGCLILTK